MDPVESYLRKKQKSTLTPCLWEEENGMNLFKREVRKYILVNDSRQIGKQILHLQTSAVKKNCGSTSMAHSVLGQPSLRCTNTSLLAWKELIRWRLICISGCTCLILSAVFSSETQTNTDPHSR